MKKSSFAFLVATWFGCGWSPVAPGTVGSVAALAIGMALHQFTGLEGWQFLVLVAALFLPAVRAADVAARQSGIEDPGFVVVDEVVGQWIALAGARPLHWGSALAALALFRLFDIWKPQPVRALERLPGGWGINADDAMAGVYAALVLWLAGRFHWY